MNYTCVGREVQLIETIECEMQELIAKPADHAAADDSAARDVVDIHYQHQGCEEDEMVDYDLMVTDNFIAYVNDDVHWKSLWQCAIQAAQCALHCFALEHSHTDDTDSDEYYYNRRHMSEKIFDDIICSDYSDDQRNNVFLENELVKNVWWRKHCRARQAEGNECAATIDVCHGAAKERITLHVLAVHMIRRNYTHEHWCTTCVLCRFLYRHREDFEDDLTAIHKEYKQLQRESVMKHTSNHSDVAAWGNEKMAKDEMQKTEELKIKGNRKVRRFLDTAWIFENLGILWNRWDPWLFLDKADKAELSISCCRNHALVSMFTPYEDVIVSKSRLVCRRAVCQ